MKITKLDIHSFRLFKDVSLTLGSRITVITGTNAVGKSTILGLLGNSSELKKKERVPILKPRFRCEFSEIFKMSQEFDKKEPKAATVTFDTGKELYYRISWQKNKDKDTKRGRLIPNSEVDGSKSSAKNKWPVLYLGLTRLYPLGEAILSTNKNKPFKISEDLLNTYSNILSLHETIEYTNEVHLTDIQKKVSFGVNTSTYNYISNSAGQDNLAQILLAVESFAKLKEKQGDDYQGGLLLIDELDAALHPSAQVKLFKYLYDISKKLSLQIVFTTHSITLLEYAIKKRDESYHSNATESPILVHYFSRANHEISPKHYDSPDIDKIRDLLTESISMVSKPKVKIISEDAEARWLIKELIPDEYISKIDLLDTTVGSNEVISLAKCDRSFFNNRVIIIDGDIRTESSKINEINSLNAQKSHILILPTSTSIEKGLLDFLLSDSTNIANYYENECADRYNITKNAIINKAEELEHLCTRRTDREVYKEWFNEFLIIFKETHLLEYWKLEHQEEVNTFIAEFTQAVDELY